MDRRGHERLIRESPVDRRVGTSQGLADGHQRTLPFAWPRGADEVLDQEVGHGLRRSPGLGVGLGPRLRASSARRPARLRAAPSVRARALGPFPRRGLGPRQLAEVLGGQPGGEGPADHEQQQAHSSRPATTGLRRHHRQACSAG